MLRRSKRARIYRLRPRSFVIINELFLSLLQMPRCKYGYLYLPLRTTVYTLYL